MQPTEDEVRSVVDRLYDPALTPEERDALETPCELDADGRLVEGLNQWARGVPGRPRIWAITSLGCSDLWGSYPLLARAFSIDRRALQAFVYRLMDLEDSGQFDEAAAHLVAFWTALTDAYLAGEWQAKGADAEEVVAIIVEDIGPDLPALREDLGPGLNDREIDVPLPGSAPRGLFARLRRL